VASVVCGTLRRSTMIQSPGVRIADADVAAVDCT
jgi:hypothetical protein